MNVLCCPPVISSCSRTPFFILSEFLQRLQRDERQRQSDDREKFTPPVPCESFSASCHPSPVVLSPLVCRVVRKVLVLPINRASREKFGSSRRNQERNHVVARWCGDQRVGCLCSGVLFAGSPSCLGTVVAVYIPFTVAIPKSSILFISVCHGLWA